MTDRSPERGNAMTTMTAELTATQALGVALSVAAPALLMEEAQAAAPDMATHLANIGYVLVEVAEVERLRTTATIAGHLLADVLALATHPAEGGRE